MNTDPNTVRCTECDWQGRECDLESFTDEDGRGNGCPNCQTDGRLIDIDPAATPAWKKVPEGDALIVFACPDCGRAETVSNSDSIEFDVPFCCECEEAMALSHVCIRD